MSATKDRLELALNEELVRRLLIKFFAERGFKENFDRSVYPPVLQDLTEAVSQLSGKIELEPYALEIDPQTGYARIGWNLFLLGNQRMYLGETDHSDLSELAKQIDEGQFVIQESDQVARQTRTAREIVTWISRALGRSMSGIIRTTDDTATSEPNAMLAGQNSQSMWERPKAIRPEGTAQF